jgi:hypothetical protein
MTIIDYLLIGGVTAVAIYTMYRLFRGWRNLAFTHDEREMGGDLSMPPEAAPGRHLATGTPWSQRAKEQLNASDFES